MAAGLLSSILTRWIPSQRILLRGPPSGRNSLPNYQGLDVQGNRLKQATAIFVRAHRQGIESSRASEGDCSITATAHPDPSSLPDLIPHVR